MRQQSSPDAGFRSREPEIPGYTQMGAYSTRWKYPFWDPKAPPTEEFDSPLTVEEFVPRFAEITGIATVEIHVQPSAYGGDGMAVYRKISEPAVSNSGSS